MDRDDNLPGSPCASDRIGSRHGQRKAAFMTWDGMALNLVRLAFGHAQTVQIAAKG
jgi:hypothetical protein